MSFIKYGKKKYFELMIVTVMHKIMTQSPHLSCYWRQCLKGSSPQSLVLYYRKHIFCSIVSQFSYHVSSFSLSRPHQSCSVSHPQPPNVSRCYVHRHMKGRVVQQKPSDVLQMTYRISDNTSFHKASLKSRGTASQLDDEILSLILCKHTFLSLYDVRLTSIFAS